MQTLIDLFSTFEALGDKTAFVNRTGVRRLVVSYAECHDLSMKRANLLAQHGVAPEDRVLIWGPNSSWWAIAYWGISHTWRNRRTGGFHVRPGAGGIHPRPNKNQARPAEPFQTGANTARVKLDQVAKALLARWLQQQELRLFLAVT